MCTILEGGVDPKSSLGTAAAFSKASKTALILANNSLLFEYASKELLKSLGKRFVLDIFLFFLLNKKLNLLLYNYTFHIIITYFKNKYL